MGISLFKITNDLSAFKVHSKIELYNLDEVTVTETITSFKTPVKKLELKSSSDYVYKWSDEMTELNP